MPRPRKDKIANKPKEVPVSKVENEQKNDGLVSLPHFAKTGTLFIGDTTYQITNGRVAVKPEHVAMVKEHIRIGG